MYLCQTCHQHQGIRVSLVHSVTSRFQATWCSCHSCLSLKKYFKLRTQIQTEWGNFPSSGSYCFTWQWAFSRIKPIFLSADSSIHVADAFICTFWLRTPFNCLKQKWNAMKAHACLPTSSHWTWFPLGSSDSPFSVAQLLSFERNWTECIQKSVRGVWHPKSSIT